MQIITTNYYALTGVDIFVPFHSTQLTIRLFTTIVFSDPQKIVWPVKPPWFHWLKSLIVRRNRLMLIEWNGMEHIIMHWKVLISLAVRQWYLGILLLCKLLPLIIMHWQVLTYLFHSIPPSQQSAYLQPPFSVIHEFVWPVKPPWFHWLKSLTVRRNRLILIEWNGMEHIIMHWKVLISPVVRQWYLGILLLCKLLPLIIMHWEVLISPLVRQWNLWILLLCKLLPLIIMHWQVLTYLFHSIPPSQQSAYLQPPFSVIHKKLCDR